MNGIRLLRVSGRQRKELRVQSEIGIRFLVTEDGERKISRNFLFYLFEIDK